MLDCFHADLDHLRDHIRDAHNRDTSAGYLLLALMPLLVIASRENLSCLQLSPD